MRPTYKGQVELKRNRERKKEKKRKMIKLMIGREWETKDRRKDEDGGREKRKFRADKGNIA